MRPDYTPGDERRVTSSTGGEKGAKSARLGGGDPLALMELARVYGFGEEKYDRYNYLRGYPFSLSIDALFRHLFAFIAGEDRDPESGLLHTAHVAWHGLTLTSFLLRELASKNPEFDDRPPALGVRPDERDSVRTYPAADTTEQYGDADDITNFLDALRAAGAEVVILEDENDPEVDAFFGVDTDDNDFLGIPIEQDDGCILYRGIHVSPVIASPRTFRDIDRDIEERQRRAGSEG